jgi:hypothetical protein
VDALGGDATTVHGNPDGSGRPYDSRGERPGQAPDPTKPGAGQEVYTGLIRELLYDCHGRFEGFVLASCDSAWLFKGCEPSLEQLILRTCRERSKVTVLGSKGEVRRVIVHCC